MIIVIVPGNMTKDTQAKPDQVLIEEGGHFRGFFGWSMVFIATGDDIPQMLDVIPYVLGYAIVLRGPPLFV